jgi:hypothetical protein
MVNKRFTLLLGIVFSLAVTCAGFAQATKTGSLATTDEKGISGKRLRELLDSYISDTNAHSTIAVLTQCYGGNMVGTLSDGRANTHVSSATSAGEQAYYGGYDDDAASATKPGAGTTSGDVHDAGTAGKSSSETPSEGGSDQPLDPVNPTDGPIKSRHILIYAGTPDGGNGTSDDDQRNKIVGNFAGEPNTSVTTVGGAGGAGSPGAGWQHPGTEAGLKDALNTIKAQMNSDEQFILFVTDHGDQDVDDQNCVETFPGTYQSVPLQFDNPVYLGRCLHAEIERHRAAGGVHTHCGPIRRHTGRSGRNKIENLGAVDKSVVVQIVPGKNIAPFDIGNISRSVLRYFFRTGKGGRGC